MKFIKTAVLLVIALFIMTPVLVRSAPADKPADNMQILREKLMADKKLVVAENMQLTESEARAFWPVYEAYQKDLDALNKRAVAMIKSYSDLWKTRSMNDEKARNLVSEFLSIQSDEPRIMQSYVAKLNMLLPSTKVARYVQIENKIRSLIRYDAAARIPLVYEK